LFEYGLFNFLWLFEWINWRNGANETFLGQISALLHTVLGVDPGSGRAVGRKLIEACLGGWGSSQCDSFYFSWPLDKRVKWCKRGIFGPNRCAIDHNFGGGPGFQIFYGPKIDRGMPGRLGTIPIWSV